ncbi:hypothetical protein D9M70_130960 [compost metagenome]
MGIYLRHIITNIIGQRCYQSFEQTANNAVCGSGGVLGREFTAGNALLDYDLEDSRQRAMIDQPRCLNVWLDRLRNQRVSKAATSQGTIGEGPCRRT